ncbi:MAG: phosphate acyltransferase PlsX [Desulfarculus sp.]|jgi:glycerol-3-phosphate acyltransferase PlsX|nr:MAG: phosphate acyltransferase PlsX [Desulfarculus sp.]
MRIALDAMGGDRAPEAVVEGAVLALAQVPADVEVVLVGDLERIKPILDHLGPPSDRLHLQHASEVVAMDEAPGVALRRLKDSSIRVCYNLHKAGEADAVVSAGNTGAVMALGVVIMGRLAEVDRPALASAFPALRGPTLLIDVGANVDCTPMMLLQFGYMGSVYAERVMGLERPQVGLLNVGEEPGKGNTAVKQASEYLKNSALNFRGNVEGRDLFVGETQVIVCDGFVGNICLKLVEGLAINFNVFFREIMTGTIKGRLGGLLLKNNFRDVATRMDYATYGGAPLLGINGVSLICHGSSSPKAIVSAVKAAANTVRAEVTRHLSEGLEHYHDSLAAGKVRELRPHTVPGGPGQ